MYKVLPQYGTKFYPFDVFSFYSIKSFKYSGPLIIIPIITGIAIMNEITFKNLGNVFLFLITLLNIINSDMLIIIKTINIINIIDVVVLPLSPSNELVSKTIIKKIVGIIINTKFTINNCLYFKLLFKLFFIVYQSCYISLFINRNYLSLIKIELFQ